MNKVLKMIAGHVFGVTALMGLLVSMFATDQLSAQKLDPSNFKKSDRVLIGKVSLRITPLREYKMQAGATGLLELYVPYEKASYATGKRLGGVDTEKLELDQDLMDTSESLLTEKDIPQWHLQRRSKIEQLETQLTKIEAERAMTKQMLENPEKYKKIFQGLGTEESNQTEELGSYLKSLSIHEDEIKTMLRYESSERKEELELGQMLKKFELRKMQFDQRIHQSYLTVPFAGEVDFLFPYIEGEENYIQAGMEVAVIRDMRELHGNVPIIDPDWRLYEKNFLELMVKTRKGNAVGRYLRSFTENISSKEELVYSFKFDAGDNESLRSQMGGTTEGSLFYKLPRFAHMVPKFLLVSLDSETFRDSGWNGVVEKLLPQYEILEVGLYSIAIARFSEESTDK
jgi:hypothetical protein